MKLTRSYFATFINTFIVAGHWYLATFITAVALMGESLLICAMIYLIILITCIGSVGVMDITLPD